MQTHCKICTDGPAGAFLELDETWLVVDGDDATLVGRRHVTEPAGLSGLVWRRYWDEMQVTAAALLELGATGIGFGVDFAGAHMHLRLRPEPRLAAIEDRLATAVEKASSAPPPPARDVAPAAAYNAKAEWVDEQLSGNFYNVNYDRPAVLDLIGDVSGRRVLDLGCGPGLFVVELTERGATVVGVDGSAGLIERARLRSAGAAELFVHDLNQPLMMLADSSFDGAVSALVYHHIDDRSLFLAEVRRVVKPGGWFVLSTTHPFADWLQRGGRYFDLERRNLFLDKSGAEWDVPFWRMSLTALIDEVLGAGFTLERLVEPVPTPETRDVDARAYRRLTREPAFLALKLRRGGT